MSALPKALPPLKGRPRSLILDLIETMIHQLKAVVGFQEEPAVTSAAEREDVGPAEGAPTSQGKTKIADLGLSARTAAALEEAGIKTAAGLARKSVATLKEVEGVGDKAIEEINAALGKLGFADRKS